METYLSHHTQGHLMFSYLPLTIFSARTNELFQSVSPLYQDPMTQTHTVRLVALGHQSIKQIIIAFAKTHTNAFLALLAKSLQAETKDSLVVK